MGNLLGAPVTEKETHRGENKDLKFGVSSMQGWRVHMEDAHIMESHLYTVCMKTGQQLGNLPDGHALFAVFDGHGGTFAAEYCGQNFCRIFSKQTGVQQYLEQISGNNDTTTTSSSTSTESQNAVEKLKAVQNCKEPLEQALQQAFLELDQELALMLQGKPVKDANVPYHSSEPMDTSDDSNKNTDTDDNGSSGGDDDTGAASQQHAPISQDGGDDSGTTACMVLVTPQWLICANAGDSRAVFSKKGRAVPLSYDHKPDDEEEERRIRTAGGYVAGGRVEGDLAVSRGLGDFRFKQISTVVQANAASAGLQKVSPIPDLIVQTRNREQDDFLIVGCDGIWDVMTNQECVSEVMSMLKEGETDMGLAAEELLDVCLEKGSKDNMTAIVVAFEPAMKIATDAAGASKASAAEVIGVQARRKQREEEQDDTNNNNTEDDNDDDDDTDDDDNDDDEDGPKPAQGTILLGAMEES